MKKVTGTFIYYLLLLLIGLSIVASDDDIYKIKKSFIRHSLTTNTAEKSKWSGFVRTCLAFWTKRIISSNKGLDTNHKFFKGALKDFKRAVHLIVPGTLWCGPGNIANNITDLGEEPSDICCRTHDLCPVNIDRGVVKYGLKNTGLFRRSECGCDENFYNCLKMVNNNVAKKLGKTYFNVLGPDCIEKVDCGKPGVKCRRQQRTGFQYQWSKNPTF